MERSELEAGDCCNDPDGRMTAVPLEMERGVGTRKNAETQEVFGH